MKNPFRNPVARRTFDGAVHCYETAHRDLIIDGRRHRGSSAATNFWRGYDGVLPGQWDAESKKMMAYVFYRAGELIRKSEGDNPKYPDQ